MAVTLLEVVNRVRNKIGLDATLTSFSEADESNLLVQFVNEAYEDLINALPPNCPYLISSSTLSLSNGTRVYSLASTATPFNIYDFGVRDTTDATHPHSIEVVSKQFVEDLDDRYDSVTGKPLYIYPDASGQVGIYPVPDGSYTITYEFGRQITSRLSETTDTFIVPDRWVRFIEKATQAQYEKFKLYESALETKQEAIDIMAEILSECWAMNPSGLSGGIFYGQGR